MRRDFSEFSAPVGSQFSAQDADSHPFRLTDEQVEHFHEFGYVSGVRILSEEQIELLQNDLAGFFDPQHEGHDLWHEYHSNESADPDRVLFHALGAWPVSYTHLTLPTT